MPVAAGTRFGDCEIVAPIASGGMGEVYRAHDKSLGRDVAVKLLPSKISDANGARRFEQEARAAAALNHPNILTIHRFGTNDAGEPYLVTELLEGETLRERLKQGPVPIRKTVDFAVQIARGVAAAHDRGIVHRDLKPENIFLTRDGVLKILDFGLAKLASPAEVSDSAITLTATAPGVVLGTIGYMSPEQVRGLPADHRSDIFSIGAIVYEMLSGERAFQGATPADTMSAILKENPPELSSHVQNLPPALGRIIHRCLEKNPADRFQSARDLAFNLELLTRDGSGSAISIAPPAARARNWKLPLLIAGALALGAATGFAVPYWLRSSPVAREPVVLRRLTDFVGMEEFPALAPDGKSVAFTADIGGRRQVWVRLLAGGTPLQVTHEDADHEFPRWSADSAALIYFAPARDPDGPGKIWQIPALGGTPRALVTSLGGGDLSHDGKHLAFFRSRESNVELVVADSDGSNPRVAASLPGNYTYSDLRWSPDDSKLGYQNGRTFDYDLSYVAAQGGKPQPITQDGNPLSGFAWLADGSGVVYSSSRGDTVLYLRNMNLWSVKIGGKELRQLTFGETSYTSPDLDRHGNLVTTRLRIQSDLWRYPVEGTPTENVARGTQLTHQTGALETPSVGPGDRELVYLSDSGGHGNLWIQTLATGRTRQLTFEYDPNITVGVPVWSPDGRHIAYVKRGKNAWNVDLWLIDPDGSNAGRVSEGGGWACWSPDSQWLYFAPPAISGFRIDKVQPRGGTSQLIRPEGQKPAVAADGRLFFTTDLPTSNGASDMEIEVAKPETAEGKKLARISGSRLANWVLAQPVLSPDDKWLATMFNDGPTTNIWAISTSTGELKPLTDFGHQSTFIARRVSWSSDGKSIFAAVGKGEADIVQLSNLLQ